MITAWRITQSKYEADAFTGNGAFNYGGRWNKKGSFAVYMSGSLALCAFEILVHIDSIILSKLYSYTKAEIPKELIDDIFYTHLPIDWRTDTSSEELQELGTKWLETSEKPVLKIPSVIIPEEFNYIFNPQHKLAPKIKISQEWKPFSFDPRLY